MLNYAEKRINYFYVGSMAQELTDLKWFTLVDLKLICCLFSLSIAMFSGAILVNGSHKVRLCLL